MGARGPEGRRMAENGAAIRVLIVEDNPYDAKIITELFRDLKTGGFALIFSDTMEKAGETFRREDPDVVLLDLNLPDSYGPQTLTRAEALFPEKPIIVMTGFYEEHLGLELIKKGAQDYLVKGKITGEWLAYSIKYSIERDKLERKGKLRENRLRNILEKTPDGVMVARRDGRVLFANHGAELIFGRSREALLKQPFTLEVDTEKTVETELRRLDGKKVPLEIRAVEIPWDSEPCRLVLLRDLSPVRTLERNRDEFISMVSHELRSPLTVVKESLDLIYDGAGGAVSPRQQEIIKIGLANADRLNRLIDALLDITKIEAGVMPMELSRADLGAMLAGVAFDYSLLAEEKKITLIKNLPEAPLSSFCDAEKFRQVLVNLVSNALKFTPTDGRITLSLRPWEGEALICVENSGQGIDPDDIPKLFNKFAQLGGHNRSGTKGTGLGLAISKGIVEMHKGRIWVESQPGKGCKFYILLPILPFEGAIREMARREIEFSGPGKRDFCAVTLTLPPRLLGSGELTAKTEAFLKASMRNSHAVVKRGEGDFTLLISNAGPKEGCRACSFIEKGIEEIYGLEAGTSGEITFILTYPGDFRDETTFLKKLSEAREKMHV